MTVEELIKHLHQFPKDLQVAYQCYSEGCLQGLIDQQYSM